MLDEFAPRVALGARDGELGLKLGVCRQSTAISRCVEWLEA